MANVKITVEMTPDEYDKYRRFLNGDYILKGWNIIDYLKHQKYTFVSRATGGEETYTKDGVIVKVIGY